VKTTPILAVLSIAFAIVSLSATIVKAANVDLPNFHVVAPGIYRGAAPTDAGLAKLKSMGVVTIIDLRISPKLVKVEKAEAISMGFNWINLPMGSDPPTKKEVTVFLSTLQKAPVQPVYVHCQHGADRTGCMIGIWRETQQNWPFAQTFAEMQKYGFNKRWVKLTGAVQQLAHS
jgi:protein tyrosine/serine phosphatase